MRIREVIEHMKQASAGVWNGRPLYQETTRDQILYGDDNQECTRVVSTCYASVEVIIRAGRLGYNFIVVHEALFWNHGDHREWLGKNTAFQKKRELLERYGICVWRNHDSLHAGIWVDGGYRDGIFYGMSTLLGWNDYRADKEALLCQQYEIPEMTVPDMASFLTQKFRLRGVRFIGNPNTRIKKVYIPLHIMGHTSDNLIIEKIDREQIHCILTLEMVDFTVCEYVRDAAMAGEEKCIFALGHFNLEEIGMEYYAFYLKNYIVPELPVCFLQSGDTYTYLPA